MEYRSMEWEEEFPNAQINVEVDVSIDTSGGLDFIPQHEY